MKPINGFGPANSAACERMIVAGLDFLDTVPASDPQFSFDPYGSANPDPQNDDAKALLTAMLGAVGGSPPAAIVIFAVNQVLWVKQNGWEKYKYTLSQFGKGEAVSIFSRLRRAPIPTAEIKIEPSAKPRPIQFEPGDFRERNAGLIKNFEAWTFLADLFAQEAADSDNPERKAECLGIASQVQKCHTAIVRFYERWEIEP